jgi:RNA polymerase sigma factor for flagellar operon FliA
MADIKDPKNQAKITHFLLEHAPLVNLHIKQLKAAGKIPAHIENDDLVFAGLHGVMDAIHKYDPSRGVSFKSYAGNRIRGKMLDFSASQDPVGKEHRMAAKAIKATPKPEGTTE